MENSWRTLHHYTIPCITICIFMYFYGVCPATQYTYTPSCSFPEFWIQYFSLTLCAAVTGVHHSIMEYWISLALAGAIRRSAAHMVTMTSANSSRQMPLWFLLNIVFSNPAMPMVFWISSHYKMLTRRDKLGEGLHNCTSSNDYLSCTPMLKWLGWSTCPLPLQAFFVKICSVHSDYVERVIFKSFLQNPCGARNAA